MDNTVIDILFFLMREIDVNKIIKKKKKNLNLTFQKNYGKKKKFFF